MEKHYRAMLHGWVQHNLTRRVGQVRGVHKDPDTKTQTGVYVTVGRERLFWPTETIQPTKAPKRRRRRRA
jgi:hypothetical protein